MAQTTAAGGDAAGDHTHGESVAEESAADGEGPGDAVGARGAGESCDALALADLAATHLLDDPGPAERHLRRALLIGDGTLPAEHLARLGSQLVMVVAGQSGRERELADVALRAAARWEGISAADASHLSFVAARAYHRAGRHAAAAAQFERSLAAGSAPYPDIEMALLRGQYGKSLKLLGRYRAAAGQFIEAARLVRDVPGRSELRAELAWSAASALDTCGEDDRAYTAYLHAAELWGELDRVGPRIRCLRAAAWLQHCAATAGTAGASATGASATGASATGASATDASAAGSSEAGLRAMYGILAELEELDPTPEVAVELTNTRRQLADMEAGRD
ncbi:hypothetical protein [Nocardia aurea]|uniref:Tetratricopeptide repeat protein n=1 Tax=Nocardia aurea TaxID=2144174 RepID=A0ABV3FLE6_9NOCA